MAVIRTKEAVFIVGAVMGITLSCCGAAGAETPARPLVLAQGGPGGAIYGGGASDEDAKKKKEEEIRRKNQQQQHRDQGQPQQRGGGGIGGSHDAPPPQDFGRRKGHDAQPKPDVETQPPSHDFRRGRDAPPPPPPPQDFGRRKGYDAQPKPDVETQPPSHDFRRGRDAPPPPPPPQDFGRRKGYDAQPKPDGETQPPSHDFRRGRDAPPPPPPPQDFGRKKGYDAQPKPDGETPPPSHDTRRGRDVPPPPPPPQDFGRKKGYDAQPKPDGETPPPSHDTRRGRDAPPPPPPPQDFGRKKGYDDQPGPDGKGGGKPDGRPDFRSGPPRGAPDNLPDTWRKPSAEQLGTIRKERQQFSRERLKDISSQRRESKDASGRIVIEEPGNRRIMRENGRAFIAHDESARLRIGVRDFREERGPRGERREHYTRPDGVVIINIYGDDGRLARRMRRDHSGREFVLIDNRREHWGRHRGHALGGFGYYVDLPAPVIRIPREEYYVDASLATEDNIYETFAAPPVDDVEADYTLDEIRYSPALRERMRRVTLSSINFEFGSWEVSEGQTDNLEIIARAMRRVLRHNSDEMFLIGGHTDAVGSDEDNLSLSDRRAEAVARVLSDEFGIPAENLVTQGYGEQYLLVDTQGANASNRRVEFQRITPLMARRDN